MAAGMEGRYKREVEAVGVLVEGVGGKRSFCPMRGVVVV